MRARRFALILALVLPAAVAAGCDSGGAEENTSPNLELARPFADDFMTRMVVGGRWAQIRTDVSPLIQREVKSFQKQLVKDQVRTIIGGEVRDDCPPNPTLGTGSDCILYVLAGRQVEPISGRVTTIRSQMHVWLERDANRWRMQAYDYNAEVGKPKSS